MPKPGVWSGVTRCRQVISQARAAISRARMHNDSETHYLRACIATSRATGFAECLGIFEPEHAATVCDELEAMAKEMAALMAEFNTAPLQR
jgi:hypothetical protein